MFYAELNSTNAELELDKIYDTEFIESIPYFATQFIKNENIQKGKSNNLK